MGLRAGRGPDAPRAPDSGCRNPGPLVSVAPDRPRVPRRAPCGESPVPRITRSPPAAVQLSMIIAMAAAQIEQAVDHLKDSSNLLDHTVEINRLENEADNVSRHAVADLFGGTHDLLDVMRWREIYGRLEGAADKCEDVANTIEAIVLKNQ